jgi:hypothetical protein
MRKLSPKAGPTKKGPKRFDYDPSLDQIAAAMTALGAVPKEIADAFGVCVSTIRFWANTFPSFNQALNGDARDYADARVQASLYNRAVGYSYDAVKIFVIKGQVVKVRYTEHCPPDTHVCAVCLARCQRVNISSQSFPQGRPLYSMDEEFEPSFAAGKTCANYPGYRRWANSPLGHGGADCAIGL